MRKNTRTFRSNEIGNRKSNHFKKKWNPTLDECREANQEFMENLCQLCVVAEQTLRKKHPNVVNHYESYELISEGFLYCMNVSRVKMFENPSENVNTGSYLLRGAIIGMENFITREQYFEKANSYSLNGFKGRPSRDGKGQRCYCSIVSNSGDKFIDEKIAKISTDISIWDELERNVLTRRELDEV